MNNYSGFFQGLAAGNLKQDIFELGYQQGLERRGDREWLLNLSLTGEDNEFHKLGAAIAALGEEEALNWFITDADLEVVPDATKDLPGAFLIAEYFQESRD